MQLHNFAGRDSWGYSRCHLVRVSEQTWRTPNPVVPATCASGKSNEGSLPHTDPRQVMSPNTSQTLPQDPFWMQEPPRLNANLRSETSFARCKEEGTPTSMEGFDVKEEPESPGFRRRRDFATKSTCSVTTGAVRRPRGFSPLSGHENWSYRTTLDLCHECTKVRSVCV